MSEKKALVPGITGELTFVVEEKHTARYFSSGERDELATPMLVAFLEAAAMAAIKPYLREDELSVGVNVNISHTAATPLGMQVVVSAKLTAVKGRELLFQVNAKDEVEEIAAGEHTRKLAKKAVMNRLMQQKHKG